MLIPIGHIDIDVEVYRRPEPTGTTEGCGKYIQHHFDHAGRREWSCRDCGTTIMLRGIGDPYCPICDEETFVVPVGLI